MPIRSFLTCIAALFCMSGQCQDSTGTDHATFKKVEVEAFFPGQTTAWVKFLQKYLNPEVPVEKGAPLGMYTVIVKFIVNRDGDISGIAPETNWGYGMEQEVTRVIKASGKWVPAMQDGRTVNAYRRQPITFVVQDDNVDLNTKVPYTFYTEKKNKLSVSVRKVKNTNLRATISEGTITDTGDGEYSVSVNKEGRVIISLFDVKKDKLIAEASFTVVSR